MAEFTSSGARVFSTPKAETRGHTRLEIRNTNIVRQMRGSLQQTPRAAGLSLKPGLPCSSATTLYTQPRPFIPDNAVRSDSPRNFLHFGGPDSGPVLGGGKDLGQMTGDLDKDSDAGLAGLDVGSRAGRCSEGTLSKAVGLGIAHPVRLHANLTGLGKRHGT